MTFDATSREFCQVRRVRTNTPLQALTLLNDPASFDTARALARRMLQEAGPAATASLPNAANAADLSRARAAFGIKLVLSREARPDELTRIVDLYERERRHYGERASAAAMVVGRDNERTYEEADLAAWTIVANVLLNLDEAVTKQ